YILGSSNGITGSTVIRLTVLGGKADLTTGGGGFTQVGMFGVETNVTTDTGSGTIAIIGCDLLSLTFGGGTQPANFYQYGNTKDGATYSAAIGNTLSPNLNAGNDILLVAASGGAGTQTVADPAGLPAATQRGYLVTIRYKNAAGGAVTWAFSGSKFKH